MKFKTKEIELFGLKLILSERVAQDVLNLTELASNNELSYQDNLIIGATIVSNALKNNIKKPGRFKKSKLENILSIKGLMSRLSIQHINDLVEQVYELEGVNLKKKMNPEENNPDEKPQMSLSDIPQD